MESLARPVRPSWSPLAAFLPVVLAFAPAAAHAAWVANGNVVCNAAGTQANPNVVADATGGAYITWRDNRVAGADIYLQHLDTNGNVVAGWPANGLAVENLATAGTIPDIAPDGAGGAIVVWRDARGGLWAQRVNSGGAIQWVANGIRVANIVTANFNVIADGFGGAIVAWEDQRGGTTNLDIYARRITATGDTLWAGNGKGVCTALGPQVLPALASDGAGGAIIGWVDPRPNAANQRFYAQRITAGGVESWPANGVVIGGAGNVFDDQDNDAVSDGAGGAYFTWTEFRNGLYRVFVQRVTAAGAIAAGWAAAGVEVPPGTVDAEPQIASDGANGCIVATAVFGTLSTQLDRFAGNATHLWTQNLTMNNGSDGPKVAGDGAGGGFAAYTAEFGVEARAGHVAANGSMAGAWPAGGQLFATAGSGGRSEMRLVETSDGDAIAAWSDNRNQIASGLDTYAFKLEHGSFVEVDPRPGFNGVLWVSTFPNPARGALTIDFVLPGSGPASLDVFDVAGRRVVSRDLTSFGMGRHRLALDAFAPGLYVARVRQGAAERAARIAVVR